MWREQKYSLVQGLPLQDALRVQCLQSPLSGAYAQCLPSQTQGLTFSDYEFRLLLKHRLGMAILPPCCTGQPCPRCSLPMDIKGEHALTCRYSDFWDRHNLVRDLIFSELQASGIACAKEKGLNSTRQRPADVYIHIDQWVTNKPLCLDVTVVHAYPSASSPDPASPEAAVANAEREKKLKYASLFPPNGPADFMAVGFDTFGQPGPSAKKFLFHLRKLLSKEPVPITSNASSAAEDDAEAARSPFTHKLSVALARGISRQLTSLSCVVLEQLDKEHSTHAGSGPLTTDMADTDMPDTFTAPTVPDPPLPADSTAAQARPSTTSSAGSEQDSTSGSR